MIEEQKYERSWHLDKRVPVALIFTIALQTAAGIWWASAMSVRVQNLELSAQTYAATSAPNIERITRVETKVDGMVHDLAELKAFLLRGPIQR